MNWALAVMFFRASSGAGRLDRPSNALVSQGITERLKVSIAVVDDRDALGRIEHAVLD